MSTHEKEQTSRRGFLGSVATGAAVMGLATFTSPLQKLNATPGPFANDNPGDPDQWFKKINGKHRIVFDVTKPNGVLPFAWPRVFLMTNAATGTPEKESSVVVIMRHDGILYAFEDRIWSKYNFGTMFKIDDNATKKPATSNPFWKPAKGTYKIPGIGEVQIGVNELQDSGVMFCVCNAAMTVYSAVAADMMKMKAEDVKKDWESGLLPGVQIVPSGVWAVGRAQEHGCKYCFAG
jgi:intracellular sulfur oxidation DsrE/DsrF family protein